MLQETVTQSGRSCDFTRELVVFGEEVWRVGSGFGNVKPRQKISGTSSL